MSHYKRGRPKSSARACSCGNKGCKRDGNAHTALDERREPLADSPVRTWPGKKDTKRWCGGHVGREHEPHWQPTRFALMRDYEPPWMDYVCAVCGKKLDHCWPWRRSTEPCKCGHHTQEAAG